ncbi:MAG: hypothetical protein H7Y60_14080 [Rhodospirillaceae bacterium]|nr:hypothetical protein [Rhodospirillales bacterium]
MSISPHLWLALSPHGYGHAAMTAPLVAELRRRRPGLRLTIQTALPRSFLETRYGSFEHVPHIPDIGFRMNSAVSVDVDSSAAFYRNLHANFPAVVAAETARLQAAQPDLVLANVPYVTIAAAAAANIPVVAYSSINWADMVENYLGSRPECAAILAEIRDSYAKAQVFLRATPAQPMTLPNVRDIGLVSRKGAVRGGEIRERLGLGQGDRLGLIAFGGIDHRLPLDRWPQLDGWFWLSSLDHTPRPDMAPWQAAGVPFADLLASVNVVVTKPGYGTFSEVGLSGVPVLYEPRPDWPESQPLEKWLSRHTRCLSTTASELASDKLPLLLQTLFSQVVPDVAVATGIDEGVDVLEAVLDAYIRS